MESFGFPDEEMETLSKMFSCEDSDQFLLHFNVANIFSNNGQIHSNFLVDQGLFFATDSNSSNSSEFGSALTVLNQSGHEFCNANDVKFLQDVTTSNAHVDSTYPTDYKDDDLIVPVFTDHVMEEILQLKAQICNDQVGNAQLRNMMDGEFCDEMQLKRKYERPEVQIDQDNKGFARAHLSSHVDKFEDNSPGSPRKKSRVSKDANKNKRNTQSKKNKKSVQNNNDVEEENNGGVNVQSSSCCSSEDDSNGSQDLYEGSNSEAKNSKGKARASRGSATDPQSLYARRRRERINERLKILQNLVPNGTKVDISTMLEEAVHYVKFLQLQIKLLSSDDLWMYAPIAYNGMDIGLYNKISPNMWS